MIEAFIVTSIIFIGVTIAFSIGFRGWVLLPVGYILGQSAIILFGAAQLFLRIPTTPRIALTALFLATIIYWGRYYWVNRPRITQGVYSIFVILAVFMSVVAVHSFSETRTYIYHVDSVEYLLIGAQLEANSLDSETNLFQMQKRMIGVPLLHSSANMFGEFFLLTVTPLTALSTLGILMWVWQQGSQKVIKDKKTFWAVLLLGAMMLAINERFIMHSLYINGHLFFAALLCLSMGVAWLMAIKGQVSEKTFLFTQALVMPTMLFTRPEAFLIVGLTLVPILAARIFTFRQKGILLAIFGVSVMTWHAFLAYLHIRHGDSVSSSIYGPILLGVGALSAILVLRTKLYARFQSYMMNVIEIALWMILGLLFFVWPQEMTTSIVASVQNIVHYWGIVAWVIPAGLFVIALLLFKFSYQSIIRFPITTFLPLMFLLVYIREGAYRFGNGDSLNRMWMQILPLVVMYIILAFILGKWRFTRPGPLYWLLPSNTGLEAIQPKNKTEQLIGNYPQKNMIRNNGKMKDQPKISQEEEGKLSPFLARQRYIHAAKFIEENDSVLDLGCGSGLLKDYIPEGTKYIGLDSVKQWSGNPDYLLTMKIGGELPKQVKKTKFNVVTALALVEHLKHPDELFHDVNKILPVDGRFILTTPHPLGERVHAIGAKIGLFSRQANEEHEQLLDKKRLDKLAKKGGFELIEYRRFLGGLNQVAVFVKR